MIVSAGRTVQQCLQVLGHLHIFLEKKFKLNSGAPGRQREVAVVRPGPQIPLSWADPQMMNTRFPGLRVAQGQSQL